MSVFEFIGLSAIKYTVTEELELIYIYLQYIHVYFYRFQVKVPSLWCIVDDHMHIKQNITRVY